MTKSKLFEGFQKKKVEQIVSLKKKQERKVWRMSLKNY